MAHTADRRPTADQALACYVKLMRCADAVTRRMHAHLAASGLTLSQFAVLDALYHKGPMHQGLIAEKILKSAGNLTLVLANLEKRGLVTRRADSADQRRRTVSLTDAGRRLIGRLMPIHGRQARQVFAVLTADQASRLADLLLILGRGEPSAAEPRNAP